MLPGVGRLIRTASAVVLAAGVITGSAAYVADSVANTFPGITAEMSGVTGVSVGCGVGVILEASYTARRRRRREKDDEDARAQTVAQQQVQDRVAADFAVLERLQEALEGMGMARSASSAWEAFHLMRSHMPADDPSCLLPIIRATRGLADDLSRLETEHPDFRVLARTILGQHFRIVMDILSDVAMGSRNLTAAVEAIENLEPQLEQKLKKARKKITRRGSTRSTRI